MLLPDWFWEWRGDRVVYSTDPLRINPTSVDLTLAPDLLLQRYRGLEYDNKPVRLTRDLGHMIDEDYNRLDLPFQPGDSVLAVTNEVLQVPRWLRLQGMLKSSLAREGVNHRTALYIDPGYRGTITLELEFARTGHLYPNEPIIQVEAVLVLPRLDYSQRKSHYLDSYSVRGNANRHIAFRAAVEPDE